MSYRILTDSEQIRCKVNNLISKLLEKEISFKELDKQVELELKKYTIIKN